MESEVQRRDKIGSIVCLVIAGIALWQSVRVPMGNIRQPGPGFLPFWVGVLLALLSAILWFEASFRKPAAEPVRFLSGEGKWPYVVAAGVALLIYTFLLEPLGFVISTFLLLIFLFRVIGKQKWWVGVTGSILVTFFTHLIFRVALKVQLPRGLF
jgi:putative tricarboxylic transport membrane protein